MVDSLIPKQLHVGAEAPSSYHMRAIRNRQKFCKPSGGLWTSTFDREVGSGWIDWCMSEQFNAPSDNVWNGYLLVPTRDARLFVIDTEQDLIDMLNWYGTNRDLDRDMSGIGYVYPNFENMLSDFDGVRLTANGQVETRLSHPHNLYGWDCESTVWFRWKFTDVEHVRIHLSEEDYHVKSVEYIKESITA